MSEVLTFVGAPYHHSERDGVHFRARREGGLVADFIVSRIALEEREGIDDAGPGEMLEMFKRHAPDIRLAAVRKFKVGAIERDGWVIVSSADLNP